jgi:hypothetical protein
VAASRSVTAQFSFDFPGQRPSGSLQCEIDQLSNFIALALYDDRISAPSLDHHAASFIDAASRTVFVHQADAYVLDVSRETSEGEMDAPPQQIFGGFVQFHSPRVNFDSHGNLLDVRGLSLFASTAASEMWNFHFDPQGELPPIRTRSILDSSRPDSVLIEIIRDRRMLDQ